MPAKSEIKIYVSVNIFWNNSWPKLCENKVSFGVQVIFTSTAMSVVQASLKNWTFPDRKRGVAPKIPLCFGPLVHPLKKYLDPPLFQCNELPLDSDAPPQQTIVKRHNRNIRGKRSSPRLSNRHTTDLSTSDSDSEDEIFIVSHRQQVSDVPTESADVPIEENVLLSDSSNVQESEEVESQEEEQHVQQPEIQDPVVPQHRIEQLPPGMPEHHRPVRSRQPPNRLSYFAPGQVSSI